MEAFQRRCVDLRDGYAAYWKRTGRARAKKRCTAVNHACRRVRDDPIDLARFERMVLVGDMHGDFGVLTTAVVDLAELVRQRRSGRLEWCPQAPATLLVFIGDMCDRTRRTYASSAGEIEGEEEMMQDCINDLAYQQVKRGLPHHVVKVLGNHEFMQTQRHDCGVSKYHSEMSRTWFKDTTKGAPEDFPCDLPGARERYLSFSRGGRMGRKVACGDVRALLLAGDWLVCHGGWNVGVAERLAASGRTHLDFLRRLNRMARGTFHKRDCEPDPVEMLASESLWLDRCSSRTKDAAEVDRACEAVDRASALAAQAGFPPTLRYAVAHTVQTGNVGMQRPLRDAGGYYLSDAAQPLRPCGGADRCGINTICGAHPVWRCDVGQSRAFRNGAYDPATNVQVLVVTSRAEPEVRRCKYPLPQ